MVAPREATLCVVKIDCCQVRETRGDWFLPQALREAVRLSQLLSLTVSPIVLL
jgi:hypothetical protein